MATSEEQAGGEYVTQTEEFVREALAGEGSGHDWWHVHRVRNAAKFIASKEGGDMLVVELASLLHDVFDWKLAGGDVHAGPRAARVHLSECGVPLPVIDSVCAVIPEVSFKGAKVDHVFSSLESRIVFDADKLDAIGAIGLARCFAYGGSVRRPIYDPGVKLVTHASLAQYRDDAVQGNGTSVNHVYEKLLLVQTRMQTMTGKQLADARHEFLHVFLNQFHMEWNEWV